MKKNYLIGSGINNWKEGNVQTIQFVVTQDCNLRCGYCYQFNKNKGGKMSFDIAKQAIDYFLYNDDLFTSKAVILDFIGGETFLEIDLISQIADYFKVKTFEINHKWSSMYRFAITTNGTLYQNEKVQKFIQENISNLDICITIDGTKEKHDLQRVYANGKGSYDDVVKNIPLWIKQFPYASTKVTVGHADIKYLKDSIIHLWDLGIKSVPANVVYEDIWEDGDDELFEQQLMELADYIIDNKLWDKVFTTLFDDAIGTPLTNEALKKNWCGSGKMIAVDSSGNLFPCLRYMKYSLNNKPEYPIGNIKTGIDFEKIRPFLAINANDQSDEECLSCDVATGCAWCQGNNYDCSEISTNYSRVKYICKMHKARCRANNYYWYRLDKEFGVSRNRYPGLNKELYFITSDDCIEHCNYSSKKENVKIMSKELLESGLNFAHNNFFQPIILHSKQKNIAQNIKEEINSKAKDSYIDIYNINTKLNKNDNKSIPVLYIDDVDKHIESRNCILKISENELEKLYDTTETLLKKVEKINLNIFDLDKNFNHLLYKRELEKIVPLIYQSFKDNNEKQFNVITDRLILDKMENCNAGEKSFSLGPNGKFYICPAFYFKDENNYIGDLENGIDVSKFGKLLSLKGAPICKHCDSFHCDRCIYLNKNITSEYNVPSSIQCKKSTIERNISSDLALKLKGILKVPIMDKLTYEDPLKLALDPSIENPYNIFKKVN